MTDASVLFHRESTRHRFTAREVEVVAVSRPEDRFVRVTLAGDLDDFASTGPGDHAKVFFPHPTTGELIAPRASADGEGIERPDGPVFARDFTPRGLRVESGAPVFDLDVLRHVDPGPAAAWAETAAIGDRIVVAGPRGSRGATQNAPRVIVVADASALPAASRWLAEVPVETEVEVVADTDGELDWVERYLAEASGRDVSLTAGGADLAGTVAMLGVDDDTYVFAAGEASRLVRLRRYLRRELALPAVQVAISGYWKRGQVGYDHHAPIDPDDPDD